MSHHLIRTPALILALGMISSFPAMADDAFTEALKTGKASMNERLRYESVDDELLKDKATAVTLRSRVGYETAPFHGATLLAEFEDIRVVGGEDEYRYEVTPPAVAPNPTTAVIADPEMTELNRIQIRYRGISKLDVIIGRQRLFFDNHRFIGNVGFRQDEQTYDAFSAAYTGIDDFTLNYAYIDGVNGFSSTDDKLSMFNTDTSDNLINISYNGFTWGKFIVYSYNLHNQNDTLKKPLVLLNKGLQFIDNETVGLRFDGAYVLPTTVPLRAIYRAEFAQQKAELMVAGKQTPREADYTLVELGMMYTFGNGAYAVTPLLGAETLGSDDGLYGLQTPYATKHAFNGWADQFLGTPGEGLEDTYINIALDFNNYAVKTLFQFHDYVSAEPNLGTKKEVDFGSETSFQVMKSIGANWIIGTKYSDFSANKDELALSKKKDLTKLWAWVELNF